MFDRVTAYVKYIGVFCIILFSAASIFFSFIYRGIPKEAKFKKLISYAPFIENKFYDLRIKQVRKVDTIDKEYILIDLDDESLQKIGSWPVDRKVWAKMLDVLRDYGVKTVSFDVMYPEEVKSCGEDSPDDIFAKAIENFQSIEGNKVILAYNAVDDEPYNNYFKEMPEDLYNFILDSTQADEKIGLTASKVESHTWPIQKLLSSSPDLGYIGMEEDSDGVFRHYKIVANMDGEIYVPSFGLRTFEAYTGKVPKLEVYKHGSGQLSVDGKSIFVNSRGETKIRWFGGKKNFMRIPLWKLLNLDGKTDKEKTLRLLQGKATFLGSTATGAHDFRNTPIDPKTPGVYAHMNVAHMLTNNLFYKELKESVSITYLLLFAGVVILLFTMLLKNALIDLFSTLLLSFCVYIIDYIYLLEAGYEVSLFFVIFCFIATYSWITFLNFNKANAEKKQIKGAFSRYVAPAIVDDMLDNPDKLKVGGERRDITCMFSDVRDFTSISEKLTATELASALNRYMGEMTDIVFATNGTLDKYIGDAIVAFWGAPIDIGDHVTQAVDAGVKMLEALPAINKEFREKNLPEFKIGLGLNSGECNVGNMGSDKIFAYTALGDTMNLGARLESSCKFYGAQIIISEYTFERMDQSKFTSRLIDKVRVKGKTKPVSVYEVLYNGHPLMNQKQALENFDSGYSLFTKGHFKDAINKFNKVLEVSNEDKSSIRLIETCEYWIKNPPKENEDFTITVRTDK